MSVVLDTPTYLVDGWLGNATDDYGVSWVVTEETGWSDGAPIRLTTSDKAGTDGGRSGPPLRGARLIVLKGLAVAPTRLAMLAAKDRLHLVCASSVDRAARYDLVVTEAHMARQTAVKMFTAPKARDDGSTRFEFELGLRADDPIRYATDAVTRILELPSDTETGLTLPITFPMVFNSAGPGDTGQILVNAGNTDVLPVITIYGPVSNPVVHNIQTDRLVSFGFNLAADEFLTVDFANRTALLNGTANRRRYRLPVSTWWVLVPGPNEIRFRASAFTAATASITYRSGWK